MRETHESSACDCGCCTRKYAALESGQGRSVQSLESSADMCAYCALGLALIVLWLML